MKTFKRAATAANAAPLLAALRRRAAGLTDSADLMITVADARQLAIRYRTAMVVEDPRRATLWRCNPIEILGYLQAGVLYLDNHRLVLGGRQTRKVRVATDRAAAFAAATAIKAPDAA